MYIDIKTPTKAECKKVLQKLKAMGADVGTNQLDEWDEHEKETIVFFDKADGDVVVGDKDDIERGESLLTVAQFLSGKLPKPKPVNFLLQYELDEDPIEEFETMREVEERIIELTEKKEELKRDSIVVYEIKSKKAVSLKTMITYK